MGARSLARLLARLRALCQRAALLSGARVMAHVLGPGDVCLFALLFDIDDGGGALRSPQSAAARRPPAWPITRPASNGKLITRAAGGRPASQRRGIVSTLKVQVCAARVALIMFDSARGRASNWHSIYATSLAPSSAAKAPSSARPFCARRHRLVGRRRLESERAIIKRQARLPGRRAARLAGWLAGWLADRTGEFASTVCRKI